MKFLEETPKYICEPGDVNYCCYVDTDSNYFHAEPLLRYLYPNFDSMKSHEKDDLLENIALKYQDYITNSYNILAKECFNIPNYIENQPHSHKLEMKTEAVIRSSYFRAPRRYAQWITKKEGIVKEELDIKGLEFKKSNFPKIFGVLFKESLIKILKGSKQEEIDKDLQSFKDSMLGGNLTLKELGNPVSVKTLNKYIEHKAKNSEVFSKIGKGAPASVKASIIYNDLLKFWKLDKEHSAIVQGDKVKWVYLKPNQFHIEAIAFLDFDLPIKIEEFINKFIDIEKTFDTILLNKLEGMYSDLGWVLNLNKFQKLFFNF